MKRISVVFLFISIFIIGLLVYRDYGIHTDATLQVVRGGIFAKYILEKAGIDVENKIPELNSLPDLHDYPDKDHGAIFEIFTVGLAKVLNLEVSRHDSSREFFFLRHLVLFLIFFISLIYMYRLILNRTGKPYISILGPLLILLSPRIFANAFYNSKDLLFMAFCIIAIYYTLLYINQKSYRNLFLAAVTGGLAASTRIIGFIFPFLVVVSIFLEIFRERNLKKVLLTRDFGRDIQYALAFLLFLVLFFPTLWENPVRNLVAIFETMGNYDRMIFYNFFFGEYMEGSEMPWYYLPFWMGITIPVITLIFFIGGLIISVLPRYRSNDVHTRMDLIVFLFFILPFLYIVLKGPVIYNGWRHMYFVFPAMVYFAVLLPNTFLNHYEKIPLNRKVILIFLVLGAGFFQPLASMIKNHPHQMVYFNNILDDDMLEKNFDRDYWGLSYKEGLEFVLEYDSSSTIVVSTNNKIGDGRSPNYFILDEQNRSRFDFVYKDKPHEYYLTGYLFDFRDLSGLRKIHSIESGGIEILGIYFDEDYQEE